MLRSDGYIATSLEAVEGADSIGVRLWDGREYPATLFASDALCGLALLRIEADGLLPVRPSEQETVLSGERVLGIGTAGDADFSGSSISLRISYPLREVCVREESNGRLLKKENLIQLDMPLGQSWIGAPLFDEYGGFLGMINGRGGEEVSFALPGTGVLKILSTLAEGKSPSSEEQALLAKPASRLGILGERGAENGMYGVRIRGFLDGPLSAAEMLKEGDLILRMDDVPVTGWEEIATLLEAKQVGETIRVSVLRNGQILTFPVILTD
jgi:serine protease Do